METQVNVHQAAKNRVRAIYDDKTIRVYQAFNHGIADAALQAGKFVSPFGMRRMTWIKPSFNWMMYRCGFASKRNQERVLGIDILREGFDWALQNSVASEFSTNEFSSQEDWRKELERRPIRVQWDPERDWRLERIEGVRAIQVGIGHKAVSKYVNEWVVNIEDMTETALAVGTAISSGIPPNGLPCLAEREYPYVPGK